jgi:AcrR family transcriptional regulator
MASTKSRILDAALAEFGEQGYFKTTMDHLAEKAGVAKGTLYWNFKSKEDLLLAAIDRQYKKFGEMAAKNLKPESPSPDMIAKVLDFKAWLDKDLQRFSRIMLSLWTDVSSDLRDKVEQRMKESLKRFTSEIEDVLNGISDGECIHGISNRTLATIIIALTRGVFLQWSIDPKGTDVEDISRGLDELIVKRIREGR